MSKDWINAVWTAAIQDDRQYNALHESFLKYLCPIFHGLVICVSQLPKNEKETLKTLIEKNGGSYSPNLDMFTTSVLITPCSDGEKYKHAKQWRIPCLTQDWVYDSIQNGHSMPVENYKLLQNKASTPTHDQSKCKYQHDTHNWQFVS